MDPLDPGLIGAKGGANGAGQPSGGGGHAGGPGQTGGSVGQPAGGSTGQPAGGSAQPMGGTTGQPTGGTTGQPTGAGGTTGQPTGAGGTTGQPTGAGGTTGQPTGAGGTTGQPTGGTTGQPTGAGGTTGQPTGGTTGQPTGAGGTTGQPTGGTTGQPTGGTTGQPTGGTTGQPTGGTTGQPTGGTTGQPTGGTTGQPTGTGGTSTPPATTAASTIVPLYTSPGDSSWNTVIAAKTAHPKVGVVAIVNPANGPGSSASSAYASGIARLAAAGIKVIGYVSTDYTNNSAATVKADIDRWKAFYPGQLGGIFFDEQSNKAGDVPYYRDLSQYAKSQGLPFTVGNPGTDTAESYVGALDMMLIYESAGLPSADRLAGWHANHAPSNFGIIPYATQLDATFVRNARKNVQYIYLQNDNLPNPWDSVPSYFSDLLAALES